MADGVNARVTASVRFTHTKTVNSIAGKFTDTLSKVFQFTEGSGDGQLNQVYQVQSKAITGSSSDTYDLDGSLVNSYGDTIAFSLVKAIIIINTGSTALFLGGHATEEIPLFAASPDKIELPVGAALVWAVPNNADGIVVTGGVTDKVTVENQGGVAGQYDLLLAGVE